MKQYLQFGIGFIVNPENNKFYYYFKAVTYKIPISTFKTTN